MTKNILVYSRKSKFTGKGESIENQIDMCKEHALRLFGSDIQFSVYEDEGYSGKNTVRPEFQRMTSDMRLGGFHVLICYRLDRISRSVSDFSTILEDLQNRGIDFISIRENFDTTTPMGRAMIHIAAVFAELERETIAERVKDNKYRQYRNGHWQGGIPPLGYESKKESYIDANGDKRSYQTLQVIPEHAEMARMIFDKYISIGSFSKLESYLVCHGVISPKGNQHTKAGLRVMLKNPVYAVNDPCVYDYLEAKGADMANARSEYDGKKGVIAYGKTVTKNARMGIRAPVGQEEWVVAVSDHEGLISGEKWTYVQTRIDEKREEYPRANTSMMALLSTLLRCKSCGSPMEPSGQRVYADGSPGFYYICSKKKISRGTQCECRNLKGTQFDNAIIETIKEALRDGGVLAENLDDQLGRVKVEQRDHAKALRQLEKKLEANDKAVKRLAMKLAASEAPETDALIYEALKTLQAEAKGLEKSVSHVKQQAAASRSSELGYEIVKDAYSTFSEKVEAMDNNEKREILRKLVRKIEWDGREAIIFLTYTESSLTMRPNK